MANSICDLQLFIERAWRRVVGLAMDRLPLSSESTTKR